MTTPQLLQRAKYGDPEAIAQLMNQSLAPKGIQATVSRQGDRLQVLLDSANEMNQPLLTQFVQNGIQNLSIPTINAVEVIGRSQSQPNQPWSKILALTPSSAQSAVNQVVTAPLPPPPAVSSPPISPEQRPLVAGTTDVNSPGMAAALEEDFSLDEELSMADIDQIVADAVKEVTTKIQSEIPYDPNEDLEDVTVGAELPTTGAATDDTMDSMIQQAMESGRLDELIDQELALPDAVTNIEAEIREDEDGGDRPLDSMQSLVDSSSTTPSSTSPNPTPASPSNKSIALPNLEAPVAERVNDGNESPADETISEPSDDPPASNILLVIVSLLTFGSIAGILGYSLSTYPGNLWQFFTNPEAVAVEQTEGAGDVGDTEGAGDTGSDSSTLEASTGDAEFPTTVPDDDNASGPDTGETVDTSNVASNDTPGTGNEEATGSQTPNNPTPNNPTPNNPTPNPSPDVAADTSSETEDASDRIPEVTEDSVGGAIASCPSVIISAGQMVTLSQMAFDNQAAADTDVYPVMGCLTNHTDKAIVSAAINYLGQPANLSTEEGEGQGQLSFGTIGPKSTVPFSVQFPVAEDTDVIKVVSIAWRAEGASQPEVLPLEFSLSLPQN